jgi:hypothetical protein
MPSSNTRSNTKPAQVVLIFAIALILGLPLLGWIGQQTSQKVSRLNSSKMMGVAPQPVKEMIGRAGEVGQSEPGVAYDQAVTSSIMPPDRGSDGFTPGVERVIIQRATLGLLVKDTRQAVDQAKQIVTASQGYVTASNVFENPIDTQIVQAEMTIRVPATKLEDTLKQLKGLATKVSTETLSASDQTEQKIDLEAQLKNLRATETQLTTIMGRANTVEETLRVQQELTNVRSQIERLTARIENLVGDAAMASIQLSLTTQESSLPVVGGEPKSIGEEIKLAVKDSLALYRRLSIAGIRTIIIVGPLFALLGLVVWLFKRRSAK